MAKTKTTNALPAFLVKGRLEAGLDEAGRGCYAGPVVAAAVILPVHFQHSLLKDSKKLKPSERSELRIIIEDQALAYAYAFVHEEEIDRINILQATYQAMHQAIASLTLKPEFLLIDGNRFRPYSGIKHQCIIKGDNLYASIAAASILAKTYRDAYMQTLHNEFPQYGWDKNKGYGTLQHRKAIEEIGLCPYHRKSFAIFPVQKEIPFP